MESIDTPTPNHRPFIILIHKQILLAVESLMNYI